MSGAAVILERSKLLPNSEGEGLPRTQVNRFKARHRCWINHVLIDLILPVTSTFLKGGFLLLCNALYANFGKTILTQADCAKCRT